MHPAKTQARILAERLPAEIAAQGAELIELRLVPPVLEDIFIALSESNHD